MVIFNSYVKLPEGTPLCSTTIDIFHGDQMGHHVPVMGPNSDGLNLKKCRFKYVKSYFSWPNLCCSLRLIYRFYNISSNSQFFNFAYGYVPGCKCDRQRRSNWNVWSVIGLWQLHKHYHRGGRSKNKWRLHLLVCTCLCRNAPVFQTALK